MDQNQIVWIDESVCSSGKLRLLTWSGDGGQGATRRGSHGRGGVRDFTASGLLLEGLLHDVKFVENGVKFGFVEIRVLASCLESIDQEVDLLHQLSQLRLHSALESGSRVPEQCQRATNRAQRWVRGQVVFGFAEQT